MKKIDWEKEANKKNKYMEWYMKHNFQIDFSKIPEVPKKEIFLSLIRKLANEKKHFNKVARMYMEMNAL